MLVHMSEKPIHPAYVNTALAKDIPFTLTVPVDAFPGGREIFGKHLYSIGFLHGGLLRINRSQMLVLSGKKHERLLAAALGGPSGPLEGTQPALASCVRGSQRI
ncbi:hypothetical protein MTO96_013230 [Rhipicephalus appendiculatus]